MSKALDVHIALADSGWILEKLASYIAEGDPGITFDVGVRESAAIQYYMNYSARRDRVSPVEMAFFTHSEEEPEARERFFSTAHAVNHCICMSEPYARELRDDGVSPVDIIVPGVDFEQYAPKLRLGVVGRTYRTGRKGEEIVRQLMELDFIDWHFTGDGWPLPGTHPDGDGMGDFYRSMDYVLIPSLYEGGPMCVLEALACGIPVIAPPVGWVSEYPHIEYPIGDVSALRGVLEELLQDKTKLASSVQHRTWEAWTGAHLRIMRNLMPSTGRPAFLSTPKRSAMAIPTTVQILHGTERMSRGGPSARVPKTTALLQERGLSSTTAFYPEEDVPVIDVAHLYNIWPPKSALATAERTRDRCNRLIFSPIFLNLALRPLWDDPFRALLARSPDPQHIVAAYRDLNRKLKSVDARDLVDAIEPADGYFSALRAILDMADHVVCLSDFEAFALRRIYDGDFPHTVVRNPVDEARWRHVDSEDFATHYGISDYVLSVGRIEPRKNQLAIALALRDSDIPVVFLGGIGSPQYADALRSLLNSRMIWVDHIEHDSGMLASAYRGARALVSTSWAEGASLSLLEAAAGGVPLIVHDTGSEREYFGDGAQYIDPADLDQIRDVIRKVFETNPPPPSNSLIRPEFTWEKHIDSLVDLYAS